MLHKKQLTQAKKRHPKPELLGGEVCFGSCVSSPRLNRSTNAMPDSEARLVRGVQLTFEESADRYAAAPAEVTPACSVGGNDSSEKEKSHSCELAWLFSLPVKLELTQIEKVRIPILVCARLF